MEKCVYILFLVLWGSCAWQCAAGFKQRSVLCDDGEKKYNTRASPVADKLNVHFVSHTHDDVGWLKTVDQYYVGSNNSIQVAAVQYILDSVIAALLEDPNRKFIYVEQAFFQRWWNEQTGTQQELVKKLVESGQLEFINGGWCMHDEATTHYVDIIDQTTLGHRFIKKQFNKVPRIGWQIDPFGHSAVQAYLLGAELGFDALFFARADHDDISKRRKDRTMEVVWRGSKSLGSSAQIFAGVMSHHYDPPEEFRYDIHSGSAPIQDDPLIFDYNVPERVDLFVQLAQEQSAEFRTNHIMWAMGEDFAFEYANTWFKQMDKLIHYVNKDGRVNVLYSTPSLYLDAKHAANETWPLKTDDFFPYSSAQHAYWTGYFTSRPALKRYVRRLSSLLQAARQLEFLVGRSLDGPTTDGLEEAMAIVQHHDGVSGTEKQHVASDYAKRLYIGAAEAAKVMNAALAVLISGKLDPYKRVTVIKSQLDRDQLLTENILRFQHHETQAIKLEQCFLLNISYCPPSEVDLSNGKTLVVVAYNPLGWVRAEIIRIPVGSEKLEVTDASGNGIPSQLVPMNSAAKAIRDYHIKANEGIDPRQGSMFYLVFEAHVPALGYASFNIRSPSNDSPYSAEVSSIEVQSFTGAVELSSANFQLMFSPASGHLTRMINLRNGASTSFEQSYCWYNGSDGNTAEGRYQASGAYIFRPNSSTCFSVEQRNESVHLTVVRGPLVEEVYQEFSSWVFQVVRLYKNAEHAEVEYMVGPIPIDDHLGKEVVTRLTTDISSAGEFYTDSNGRDFIKRVRNFRADWELNVTEEVAGNYYPLNLGAYLADDKAEFSVLVDRSVGGSSIADGQLEVMLHRRLLYDDGKGVDAALNETVCSREQEDCQGLTVEGTFYLNLSPKHKGAQWRRSFGQKVLSPLQLTFAVIEEGDSKVGSAFQFSAMLDDYQLPPNIALLTLQELEDQKVLVRLAHLYEVDEDDDLSNVATVDLRSLFGGKEINSIEELSLSGNQKKSEIKKMSWKVEGDDDSHIPLRGRALNNQELLVELGPMEIRTFEVTFV